MSLFLPIIDALNRANVSYVVVGGFATVLHGHARMTADVDVVIALDAENILRAIDALNAQGFTPRLPVQAKDFANEVIRASWIAEKGMTVFSLYKKDDPLIGVDLFAEYPMDYNQMLARSAVVELKGTSIRTCAIDHLIQIKSAVGRPRDLEDVKALRRIRDDRKKK